MKKLGLVLIAVSIVCLILIASFTIIGKYQYDKNFKSYWELADKSSTVEKKSENIDKFVDALENGGFEGMHNAVFLKTPNNSFDQNFLALKTLQQRLHEIKNMNISSFEYQTAMQQITAQEQGEANAMLSVFRGVWWKTHHLFLWNWICAVQVGIMIAGLITEFVIWLNDL